MDIDTRIALYAASATNKIIDDISSGKKNKKAGLGFLHGTNVMKAKNDVDGYPEYDGSESWPYWCWYTALMYELKELVIPSEKLNENNN